MYSFFNSQVFFFLLSFTQLSATENPRTISFTWDGARAYLYGVPLHQYNSDQKKYMTLDFKKQYSIFNNIWVEPSTIEGEKEIYFGNHTPIKAKKVEDTWTILGESFKFKYYSVCTTDEYKFDTLAFTFHFDDPKFSFLHMLNSQNVISRKVIGYGKLNSSSVFSSLYVSLGGLKDDDKKHKQKAKCKVKEGSLYWSCMLKYVYFNHEIYNENNQVIIQGTDYITLVPQRFYDTLEKIIFSKYIESKEYDCDFDKNGAFLCRNDYPKNIPVIEFGLDEGYLAFDLSKKFYRRITYLGILYVLPFEKNVQDPEVWEFGRSMLEESFLEFDYDEKEIRFYNDKSNSLYLVFKEERKIIIMKLCCFTSIIMNLLTVLIYIFIKFKKCISINYH